ncbi:MAG: hypothetical protein IPI00_16530 [Flavobacteriales bacterium]|nr:hypothetical protein [Flavobacteriales bacterium]
MLTHAQLAVPGIIPAPAELTLTKGDCRLDRPWKLIGTSIEAKALTEFLSTEISNIRSASDVVSGTPLPIILEQVVFDTLVPDGYYSLGVEQDRINITSNSEQGLFYGTRTLIQLLEMPKKRQHTLHGDSGLPSLQLARNASGCCTSLLPRGIREKVHRPVGAIQDEQFSLALNG